MKRLTTFPVAMVALLALLALGAALNLRAQFWAKKTYEQWSSGDCSKMLNDSPWAKTRIVGRVFIQKAEEPAAVPGRELAPQVFYVVRLLSAAPIRQAMVRADQLDPKYATLTAEKKAELDARHKEMLENSFPDRVVIQIEYSTNALGYRAELVSRWQAQPEEQLKQQIYLITPRGRIPPARIFVARGAGGAVQLVFPRVVDGRAVIEPGDKSLALEFPHPTVGVLAGERVYVEFKVKNMLLNNELVF